MLAMGHVLTPMLAAASMDGAIMTTVLPSVEMEMLAMGNVKSPIISAVIMDIVIIAVPPIIASIKIMDIVIIAVPPPPPLTLPPRVPQFPSSRQSLPSQA